MFPLAKWFISLRGFAFFWDSTQKKKNLEVDKNKKKEIESDRVDPKICRYYEILSFSAGLNERTS